jgi:hypothetical protein
MKWLSKLRHRWPKLLVDAHRMKGAVKQQIGDEGSWTARQGKSNITMRQPVLTGAGPPCYARATRPYGRRMGDGRGAWCAIVFSRGTRDKRKARDTGCGLWRGRGWTPRRPPSLTTLRAAYGSRIANPES